MVTPLQVNDKEYSINYPTGFAMQNQINEITRRKWYEVPIPEVGVVIDAGANVGIYSLYMSEFAKQVYSIEPYTKSYEYLELNIKENKRQNIHPHKLALAGTEGKRTLYSSYNPQDPSGYSLLPVGHSVETVKTKTIAQFMKDEKIPLVHILKTDIEGAEQEVFSADDFGDVARKILCITGEYHIQCRNLQEVLKYHGYDYSVSPRGVYTAVRRIEKIEIPVPTIALNGQIN